MRTETCYNGEQEKGLLASRILSQGAMPSEQEITRTIRIVPPVQTNYYEVNKIVDFSEQFRNLIKNLMGTKSADMQEEDSTMEELRGTVNQINTTLVEMHTDLVYIKDDIKDLKNDTKQLTTDIIPGIKTEITVASTNISNLEKGIDKVAGKINQVIIAIIGALVVGVILRIFDLI